MNDNIQLATNHKNNGSEIYTILLILTDGTIHDMDLTKDSLVILFKFI